MAKLTLHDIMDAKNQGRQFTEVFTCNVNEAIACAEAGVEIIMCMADALPMIRKAVPNSFIISADRLNRPHIASPDQAIAAAFKLMDLGADAVYSGMSMRAVRAMAEEHIPVVGHIGFVPYRSTWIGGTRAVGKTCSEAVQVYEAAKAYQDAGALAVEIEIVPQEITAEIAKRLDLALISMGAGREGAAVQYLFATDVLGTNPGHIPRHAKVYGNIGEEEARVQRLRVEAFKALAEDVRSGQYPESKHSLTMKQTERDAFLKALDQRD